MIQIETLEIAGFRPAIRGMRNPLNSWERSDSVTCAREMLEYDGCPRTDFSEDPCVCHEGKHGFCLGVKDAKLAHDLAKGGPVHAKYRRMINVYADIVAPLYWWKEFDTYRVGVEKNSCSTMHTITNRPFSFEDFSTDHLGVWKSVKDTDGVERAYCYGDWPEIMDRVIVSLNKARAQYMAEVDPVIKKQYWWQIIQLLPSSYNQRRTVMMSYEALSHMYTDRRLHKLNEWRKFCEWVTELPYFGEIIMPVVDPSDKG